MPNDFLLLVLVSLAHFASICFLSVRWVTKSPSQRYWPLDIRLLNSAFFTLLAFQFLFASQYKSFRIGEQTLNCDESLLVALQTGNLLCFWLFAGLTELLVPQAISVGVDRTRQREGRAARALFLMVAFLLCGFLFWQIRELGFFTFIEAVGARQYKKDAAFVILNASPFLLVASLYLIFKSNSLAWSLGGVSAFTVVAGLSGGRGNIVSAFLLLLCALLANGRPPRPFRMFIFGFIPLLVVLQIYTAYVRYAGFRGQGNQDIWFETLVESESFAIWKSVYAVATTSFELPYPFYSLTASLFFPVPRAAVPFKPEPPSSLFTQFVSPVRFENTGSEITLSGAGTLIAEFGTIGGPLLFTILVACLSALQYRISMKPSRQIEAFVLYFYVFSLWRSDLFTASRILWTYLIVMGMLYAILMVVPPERRAVRIEGERASRSLRRMRARSK
ncbi:hypothetical protein [Bradyrhizobium sp. CB1015]|uniref:hypothetical protein n=1 Tax=Bradyrhizobium sp. CB1015 TaxID=2976822 RepID=UPI0021A9F3B5|nr:hypothetical protein [Bradyrhizobium sp. CB1015]UWU91388.1 hypothetical protein N2604_33915 [Bradyrhizobium sp. CB1015]